MYAFRDLVGSFPTRKIGQGDGREQTARTNDFETIIEHENFNSFAFGAVIAVSNCINQGLLAGIVRVD